MERETGFEPATSSLGSWHSTTELLPLAERSLRKVNTEGPCARKSSTSRHPQDSITTAPPGNRPTGTFSGHDRYTPANPKDRKSHPGNAPDRPETVAAATASEGTQREHAQNRIQHAPGVGDRKSTRLNS